MTGALALLLLVAMTALGPLLQGAGWWWLMAVEAVAVLVVSAGIRSLGPKPWVVPLAGAGVIVGSVTLLFGGGTGLLWLVPTGDTIDRFQRARRIGDRLRAVPGHSGRSRHRHPVPALHRGRRDRTADGRPCDHPADTGARRAARTGARRSARAHPGQRY
ncbi:hypothetical protein [Cryobacterium breve]|uniref:hypothetical protein n=1 Tax=Cryobacterium breve TaxID=1259258 RepID=UPI00248AF4D7|nr:hypothetical protein [Cryobacterium breve]